MHVILLELYGGNTAVMMQAYSGTVDEKRVHYVNADVCHGLPPLLLLLHLLTVYFIMLSHWRAHSL